MNKPGILILTPFFEPNIGGVETHLTDLTAELIKNNYQVFVLTYSPLTIKVNWLPQESHPNLFIRRYRWFGQNLFHTLERYPLLDFLYLTPYLLLRSFIWMIFNHTNIDTIHTHGFNAAFIGNILAKVFHKKHITSTHAVYDHIGKFSQYLVKNVLSATDQILCLSQASANQLTSWGINPKSISVYRYWINLTRFSPAKIPSKFTFIFVGRLITKKGILLYLKLAKIFPKYGFLIVGTGPEMAKVDEFTKRFSNIRYLGTTPQYQLASALITPSLYAEGYGRVVMEAVASGLPVIASNLGGLPEALDSSVAILIRPTLPNLITAVKLLKKTNVYHQLQTNCRSYALKKFSPSNFKMISRFY